MKVLCVFNHDVKKIGGTFPVSDGIMIDVAASVAIIPMWRNLMERSGYRNPVLTRYLPECGKPHF